MHYFVAVMVLALIPITIGAVGNYLSERPRGEDDAHE